jgi:hypothetical protein
MNIILLIKKRWLKTGIIIIINNKKYPFPAQAMWRKLQKGNKKANKFILVM